MQVKKYYTETPRKVHPTLLFPPLFLLPYNICHRRMFENTTQTKDNICHAMPYLPSPYLLSSLPCKLVVVAAAVAALRAHSG